MEIKNVEKEKVEYPKINEISEKKLKNCIPNRWRKIGIVSILFEMLTEGKAFASSQWPNDIHNLLPIDSQIAGGVVYHYENPVYVGGRKICGITAIISTIILFMTLIKILRKKLTIEWNKVAINNDLKVSCILSIILFIISAIGGTYYCQDPIYVARMKICRVTAVISIIMVFATLIKILRKKLTIEWSSIKIKNYLKALFIVSIICFTISIIGFAIFNYLLI